MAQVRESKTADSLARPGQVEPEQVTPEKISEGIALEINGESYTHTGDPGMPLLWYLRDVLRLTGTKYADAGGTGGFDLVLVNDKPVSAITQPMSTLAGKRVVTVEGLSLDDGRLHALQQAFVDADAIGCGYCIPGWLISASALLGRHEKPGVNDIDTLPNLCRCGRQSQIRAAIRRAGGADA